MKTDAVLPFFVVCLILITGCQHTAEQTKTNPFQCNSSRLGIDSVWADSNKVYSFLIPVRKNTSSPEKGDYTLAVVVVKAIKETAQPPLLYLHGGPGIATIENVKRYLTLPTWQLMREQHDLIFFDYRGTGFSEPQLCTYIADSLAAFTSGNSNADDRAAKETSLYKDCREQLMKDSVSLSDFTSAQLAADAEEIRKALAIKQWSIYAVSYGTTVGLNMIRSFPSNINSVILDSPYPPNAPWPDFVRPFEASFTVLETRLSEDTINTKRFSSLRKDFVKAVTRLNEKPVELSDDRNGEKTKFKYNGDDFAWSIWNAMLSPKSIPFVPLAIHEVANGNDDILIDWTKAFSSPDAFGTFSEPQSHAILCYEARPRKIEDSQQYLSEHYPEFASFNSGYNTKLCDIWRPEALSEEMFAPVVSDIPVLVLSGEFDPVCPPLFGTRTAKTLTRSTLVIVPSASHAAIHVDDCLRTLAHDFIESPGKKPATDCVYARKKIEFVMSDLPDALKNY